MTEVGRVVDDQHSLQLSRALPGSPSRKTRRSTDTSRRSRVPGLNFGRLPPTACGILGLVGGTRPITHGYCPFDGSGPALAAAVAHEIASLALLPTTMRPARVNVARPRAGPPPDSRGRGRGKRRLFVVLPQTFNVGHTQIGIDQGPLPDPACLWCSREITLSLGDIWELSVPPKEDL